jgi:molybdopterin/thiamine biosynthesis adenylyltransferase/nitroreductase
MIQTPTLSTETLAFRATRLAADDENALAELHESGRVWRRRDLLPAQLRGLLEIRAREDPEATLADLLDGCAVEHFGVWIHLPWSGELIRVLPAPLFHELRLDRNRNKITREEQQVLRTATVGICGLSVGNAMAMTLAQEGVGGRLILADFDVLETSNLNRIRAPLHAVGLPKTVVLGRQLAAVDPFLEVECLHRGLDASNVEDFVDACDVVIDAADGLGMKVRLREVARAARIPVLMETSDRGMLDVERFDEEPDRPLLHGRLEGIASAAVADLSAGERLALVARVVGDVSTRAAASMIEVGDTLSTWPQLASDVALGGATIAAAVRRILLGQPLTSGRRHVDLGAILDADPIPSPSTPVSRAVRAPVVPPSVHRRLVEEATLAPSAGNCQPWAFRTVGTDLVVAHDRARSASLLDAHGWAGLLSVGAAIEGLRLAAGELGLRADIAYTGGTEGDVAVVRLEEGGQTDALARWVRRRFTDRRCPPRTPLEVAERAAMNEAVGLAARVGWVESPDRLDALARPLGAVDRVRFLRPRLHREMWDEIRWSDAEARRRPDGIGVDELALAPGDADVLGLLARPDVAAFLRRTGGGRRLGATTEAWVRSASAIGLLGVGNVTATSVLDAGRAMYRLWLAATSVGRGLQPIGVAAYMIQHVGTPHASGYTPEDLAVLERAEEVLQQAFPGIPSAGRLLLFRVVAGGDRYAPARRRPVGDVYQA